MSEAPLQEEHGLIAWIVRNRITPNILMVLFLLGGLLLATRIKKEVFPAFDLDLVTVRVAYPGASPAEVEQGIVLAVEEAVRGLDGVKQVNATAAEGFAMISIELAVGADHQKMYQDIQQEIGRIRTFPESAEEPRISLVTMRRGVLTVQLYGDVSEVVLRDLVEQVRDRLLQDPQITQVDLEGARDFEIRAEIPQAQLRAYDVTLGDIAARIRASAVEIPGGSVRTQAGEILIRMEERRDWARQFARIPILTAGDGTVVRLGDMGRVRDTFQETNREATYNGHRTIGLSVSRVGDQTPTGVAEAVRSVLAQMQPDLPPGVHYAITHDRSQVYRQRLSLLLHNGMLGLVLVLLILGLFLDIRLAFWVTMGIPVSFLGAFLFLPALGVSINMISMFAFIVALGIVVDDAIIAGDNIYEYRQQGMGLVAAAVQGARDVAIPVIFSVLTNLVAFMPMFFVPGAMGKIWRVIPLVVCTVFLISLVESLLVLPAHLSHSAAGTDTTGVLGFLQRKQSVFSAWFGRFVATRYAPLLDACLRHRYVTTAVALAALTLSLTYVASGRMGIILMPKVEADLSVVTAMLPYGSPLSAAHQVRNRLTQALAEVVAHNGGSELVEGVYSTIDENKVEVTAYLTDPGTRPISTSDLTQLWRKRVGAIPGIEHIRFQSDRGGPGSGAAISIQLSHRDITVLDHASATLAAGLAQFPQTKDIDDGYTPGKRQLDYTVSSEGYSLALTAATIARQVRNSFYGAEALRQQRGRNEVRMYVSLPKDERSSEYDVEQLLIRTPAGPDVPLRQVADVTPGRAYTTITRRDGRRTVLVTADVVPVTQTSQVLSTVTQEMLPQLQRDFPGLSWSFEGRQADMGESMSALFIGFIFALGGIYILLAVPFGSYSQPLIVMMAIPFGIFGAIVGHLLMGYSLSVISLMGIVALAGVVVNDALVMIDYANTLRAQGAGAFQAIHNAGTRRFRPILLTTLTTFGGLSPMIFETSRQARFLIPMALSLGYGILFATAITLLLIPSLYMILEDVLGHLPRRQIA